jgi:hypothetical protein
VVVERRERRWELWAEASKGDQRGALARDSEHVEEDYVQTEGSGS